MKSRINTGKPKPAEEVLATIGIPDPKKSGQEVLEDVTTRSEVLQDFRPLADSLEWELGNLYWARAGVLPFISNEVPFVINNSGAASERAARVLFDSCESSQDLPSQIRVLELGAGTGLFARYLLDAFRVLCDKEGRDFYDRLVYYVSDGSPQNAVQWTENNIFRNHDAQVVAANCDAMEPSVLRLPGGETIEIDLLQAVFCNYLLDVLPCAVVRKRGGEWEQLCVRSHLDADAGLLEEQAELSLWQLREAANSGDPEKKAQLLPFMNFLRFEAKFVRVAREDAPPWTGQALETSDEDERVILNYGAIEAMHRAADLLVDSGFLLINDYGPTRASEVVDHSVSQRFGATTAVGLNFPLLAAHFSARGENLIEPEGDAEQPIHARLLVRGDSQNTRDSFCKHYDSVALEYVTAPALEAREHLAAGRNEDALHCYREALSRNPRDWALIGEIAEFVGLQLRDFSAGIELAREAIELNPNYSTQLWNLLGDCMYCLQQVQNAHEAYLQASRIDPADVRTNFNLSYTYLQMGNYDEALAAVAMGLANDRIGAYRERLLEKQQQILAAISGHWLGERERLLKREQAFA